MYFIGHCPFLTYETHKRAIEDIKKFFDSQKDVNQISYQDMTRILRYIKRA